MDCQGRCLALGREPKAHSFFLLLHTFPLSWGSPKAFHSASYSHKDIKKKTQQKELLGMAVKCFIRKTGRGNRVTLSALAQQA